MSLGLFVDFDASDAVFSPDRQHRYTLSRWWNRKLPPLLWCMVNPSDADEERPDPTLGRCVTFSRGFGYGGCILVNEFAVVSSTPKILLEHDDPVGPGNDRHIRSVLEAWPESPVVCLRLRAHRPPRPALSASSRPSRRTPRARAPGRGSDGGGEAMTYADKALARGWRRREDDVWWGNPYWEDPATTNDAVRVDVEGACARWWLPDSAPISEGCWGRALDEEDALRLALEAFPEIPDAR